VRKIEAGPVETTVQKHLQTSKKAPKLTPENTRINWQGTSGQVCDTIRGLCPYPGAWTQFDNHGASERVKIYGSRHSERVEKADPGSLLQQGNRLFARTGDGWLEITEMQLPGKRRMFVEEILNGLKIEKNARFL
jgi:methionyl-tRNA formyltransferase